MARRLFLALLLLAGSGTAAAEAMADDRFVQAMQAAADAFESRAFERMLEAVKRAEAERPGHPEAIYALAVAHAQRRELDAGIAALRRFADMGLTRDVAGDAQLAALRAHPQFAALASRIAANAEPRGTAIRLATHPVRHFIPQGIAYDRDTGRYFLSSVYRREIVVPGEADPRRAFVSGAAFGLYAALGMFAEPNRRLLWVASAALPQMRGYDESLRGRSAVFAFDLDSGALSRRFQAPAEAGAHAFGDITVGRRGEVFVSDRLGGRVYAVDRIRGTFTRLGEPGQLRSPRGLVQSLDRRRLFVADHARGLYVYDFDSERLQRVQAPERICLYGIDGLAGDGDRLIGVQNGVQPNRVIRLSLNDARDAVETLEVLVSNDPDFDGPTQGVVRGRSFYVVANSHWSKLGDDNELPPATELSRPTILRIPLDR